MQICHHFADKELRDLRPHRNTIKVGFVPTMGALHAGHLSLLHKARRENDYVVLSIFVNPLQFGPQEDYERYPRPLAQDQSMAEQAGVDLLLLPTVEEFFPSSFATRVCIEGVSQGLCGDYRPGHFAGVAIVLLKLMQWVQPDRMYMGQKDAQQLAVVEQMVRDLQLPVCIVACPTYRTEDGLALSSRNQYLSPADRAQAPFLYQALSQTATQLSSRERARDLPAAWAIQEPSLRNLLTQAGFVVEYVALRTYPAFRQPQTGDEGPILLLAAVYLGGVRLIDNVPVP